MFKELMDEFKRDPDPLWLKVSAVVVVPLFFLMMVML